jgi:uncharacterized protein YhhL (DUF1145 family)
VVNVSSGLIEFLIAATICVTAIANIIPFKAKNNRVVYVLTLFFGLIHGLGFSNYLKELLGRESNILTPLLAFNIGLELGQLLILAIYFALLFITVQAFRSRNDFWRIFVSGMAFGISVILMINKAPAVF